MVWQIDWIAKGSHKEGTVDISISYDGIKWASPAGPRPPGNPKTPPPLWVAAPEGSRRLSALIRHVHIKEKPQNLNKHHNEEKPQAKAKGGADNFQDAHHLYPQPHKVEYPASTPIY